MAIVWAESALLEDGWFEAVRISIDANGLIESVTPDTPPEGIRRGVVLPSPANVHSHSFQRSMAGLTERRGPDPSDSFWTWRQLMYRFLDQLTPDDVEAIAAFVQMEMLEAGYSTNVEFHYLHHQSDGRPYAAVSEMSDRIVAAAQTTGVGLTLLPVLYQYAGCDKRPLGRGQIRFGNSLDDFQRLFESATHSVSQLPPDSRIGVAPHSLRAVSPDDIVKIEQMAAGGPVHMHLAEQMAEVNEVVASHGVKPVRLFLESCMRPADWCVIHCTQMDADETRSLAASGAVVGLCPITEASLGDGIFNASDWMAAGGSIGIGSDSNVRISLSEELRLLEYSQRLRDHSRAALASQHKSTGRRLFEAINAGGARAAGRNSGRIGPGYVADLVALDSNNICLANRKGDSLLDSYIFSGSDSLVADVWSSGRHLVVEGRHIHHASIEQQYRKVMQNLKDVL